MSDQDGQDRLAGQLTAARLAVNDWHSCSTQDELDRWRVAQQRLIAAAKAVGAAEVTRLTQEIAVAKRQYEESERGRDEGEAEIWDEVLRSVLRAWDGIPPQYLDSPLELVSSLIEERDNLAQENARLKTRSGHLADALWLALDIVREHVGGFSAWPDALKQSFAYAITDTSPLTPAEIARGLELAAKFGWESDDAAPSA